MESVYRVKKEGMFLIIVNHLTKRYGDHTAVDDLSFEVKEGQIYGFLGPNGAGKSTTMNIMTGYIASTKGEVLINGHDILKEPEEAKKCIGYLPEMPPLYYDMTVKEYLRFAAELKKIPRAERTKMIEEVMEMVKISDMGSRLIKNLSKGYKQRVGLAQAILGYPQVIILDEPTVGLDPKQIIEIRELIKELGKKHTVILSSHILSEVSAVCDYIMIISHGRLVASNTPEKLETMAAGGSTLELSVKGEKERIENVLRMVSGILQIEMKPSKDEVEAFDIKLETENCEIREELFYKLAEEKCPILRMQFMRMSLEDVFLELTQEEEGTKEEIFDTNAEKGSESNYQEQEVTDHDSNL
jgi:ABC-2 type transport system ATP-binding protein